MGEEKRRARIEEKGERDRKDRKEKEKRSHARGWHGA